MTDRFPDIHERNLLGEQLDMAYRDVSRFEDNVELSDPHQAKIDHLLDEYPGCHAVIPVERGPDGTVHTMGNPDANLPKYDPDNPHRTQVPFIVRTWNLNDEWAVRAPDTIEDILGGFALHPGQGCHSHFGPPKLGVAPSAVMARARADHSVAVRVRIVHDVLDDSCGGRRLFFELDADRRVRIPSKP
jgi:hypothetical protein